MAFSDPANRRVAGHLAQSVDAVGEQQSSFTHARARERGFGASMTAADHNNIQFLWEKHGEWNAERAQIIPQPMRGG